MDKDKILSNCKLIIRNDGDCINIKCRECPCSHEAGTFYVCRGYDANETLRLAKNFIDKEGQ